MSRRSDGPGEISAGSMADIAFLLLIFFLVTTTMDTESGILRQLPPLMEEEMDPPPVKERDVYVVLVNRNDQLLVENKFMDIGELKAGAIEFLKNPNKSPDLPIKVEVTKAKLESNLAVLKQNLIANPDDPDIPNKIKVTEKKLDAVALIGEYEELPPSAVISLQNDNGTSYKMYIQVQNELQSAVNELRDETSMKYFSVPYSQLDINDPDDQPKINAVRMVYPQRISEAEPKETGAVAN